MNYVEFLTENEKIEKLPTAFVRFFVKFFKSG